MDTSMTVATRYINSFLSTTVPSIFYWYFNKNINKQISVTVDPQ
jgi:hypothetical protein